MNSFFYEAYVNIKNWFNQTLWSYNEIAFTPYNLFRFLIFVFLALWAAQFIFKTINKIAEKNGPAKRFTLYRLARVIYYIILCMGLLFAISSLGFDLSHIALIAGALSLGLGFGLQNIFNNFFSGIILLFEDQLKLGDFIEVDGNTKGEILELNFRTITLKTQNGSLIFVPNSSLISENVTLSWTPKSPYRSMRIPFAIKPTNQKDLMCQTLIEEMKKMPLSRTPPLGIAPLVYLTSISHNHLVYECWIWIEEKEDTLPQVIYSQYLSKIEEVLNQLKIELS